MNIIINFIAALVLGFCLPSTSSPSYWIGMTMVVILVVNSMIIGGK